ncbi:alanine racemase [Streptacidiphilus sp. N1-3]|uniref:ornithine decarboxylase n=1 Tax=Streptacidiphilus alkalitolerans TaxID=3342712 RepID=A0ABV6WX62_9ACTN
MTHGSALLRAALAAADQDRIIFDLDAVERRYAALRRELPQVAVRFAVKACPVDEVLAALAGRGAGFDAASPQEIGQAVRAGARSGEVHYGNTVKSDQDIADAYRLGIRDFATDSLADVAAIAVHAPGSRVFCRLATSGEGALWGLSKKYGCSPRDALRVLGAARAAGLVPAGLSVHVGSQQMTTSAWQVAFDRLAWTLAALNRLGIHPDHVNLGGGLPALGYLDRRGRPLEPALDAILAVIRQGVRQLREVSAGPLDFVMEPGRHLVADAGAIRARVARLTIRQQLNGAREYWLFLSCGKFNGLYEMDALQYRLVFPTHPDPTRPGADSVPAVLAGPTCDSDDAYSPEHALVPVPRALASGDPVWVLSAGAYATSYLTQGFNGFRPLEHSCVRGGPEQWTPGVGLSEEAAWATV